MIARGTSIKELHVDPASAKSLGEVPQPTFLLVGEREAQAVGLAIFRIDADVCPDPLHQLREQRQALGRKLRHLVRGPPLAVGREQPGGRPGRMGADASALQERHLVAVAGEAQRDRAADDAAADDDDLSQQLDSGY